MRVNLVSLSLSVDRARGCQTLVRVNRLREVVSLSPQSALCKKVYSIMYFRLSMVISIARCSAGYPGCHGIPKENLIYIVVHMQ